MQNIGKMYDIYLQEEINKHCSDDGLEAIDRDWLGLIERAEAIEYTQSVEEVIAAAREEQKKNGCVEATVQRISHKRYK